MSQQVIHFEGRDFEMEGSYKNPDKINMKDASVVEGLSKLTETTLEFFSNDSKVKHADFLGQTMIVSVKEQDESKSYFSGYCVSVDEIGEYQGKRLFTAEIRPWLWFLTLTRNNRIFQEKSTVDIIQEVLSDHGFWGNVQNKLSATYEKRHYCVQYRESDYDFICRLMEEDGIYFYFAQDGKKEKLVLADSISAHSPTPHGPTFEYHAVDGTFQRDLEHIYDWLDGEQITTGKVSFEDYNFETPLSDLLVTKQIIKGNHSPHNKYEHYDYPGRYGKSAEGNTHARVRIESLAVDHEKSKGVCNIRGMRVGQTFKIKEHPTVPDNSEFLLTEATHYIGIDTDYETDDVVNPLISRKKPKPEDLENLGMAYRCTFGVIPKDIPYRAPQKTEWPEIAGLHTAVVTGPKGDEIYTDQYGRIKVQFHWDRKGKMDENTTCFVRVAMPWTGDDWGMFGIPRIGQEVVIQFEEGDPDRPICTGMMYHKETMPPYAFPTNKTQTGIVTRSTKDGSKDTFHELVFEDKKEAEFIRLQSERDYKETIKNNAVITIGLEHKDKGDLTQTIQNHKTETLKEGDHTFTVEKGKQTIKIKKDHTETIEGKSTQTITGNTTQKIKTGNYTQTVEKGKWTTTVKLGDSKHETKVGKTTIKALSKLELICGMSKITMEPTKITIKSLMVDIKADTTLNAQGLMTTVKGDAMLTLKGGMVMIN
ncbi:MAG: type VI secretion system tip protein TssI/VgrG [Pseudomonadota bacterium]